MEALLASLHAVLGHAVAALEHEDRDEFHQSLQEYNNAWCALSCALELQGAGNAGCDRLPALVRETCVALLETYSVRHEVRLTFYVSISQKPGPGRKA